jgi:hypothetical protein
VRGSRLRRGAVTLLLVVLVLAVVAAPAELGGGCAAKTP